MTDIIKKNAWVAGLFALLIVLLVLTKVIQPSFGMSGLESVARAALPFAFATAGMAVVVIVGGIDLSVASMMAVCAVTAAVLMERMAGVPAILIVLALGFVMGLINGGLIVLTRVPDIVVTLAMLFVWEGVALLILESPGGATTEWLKQSIRGSVIPFVPNALAIIAACVAVVWIPLRRSKLGISIYATGSDDLAAFRSGVAVGRTKIMAYGVCGIFCAFGGLSLASLTGIGEPVPGPYLMASVAAVVLGGVVLGGGRGGLLGPIIAVFILRIVRTILTLLAVDPNVTTIIEGTIMVGVVMLGTAATLRGARK
ncbi:ABC transporter permease [Sulfitobacter mediterraneus]|uniref:ABC transporter permease n=1 Tax=Sulfitobacter mediterraneus TaxID=83219 RepID=UPI001931A304|nr:ABC transporter permease [Sulfitobacter mediterraneus]MBM1634938.1 ABC transporter permease [Sulfitobacter mediterraneus]MBM1642773.1 ABC transporter permease [Sulfitobacter mediterraneus]MBM1646821.1 ABC transporter permease [Sulfitobacter mediterraneus]MBM1650851.1 ABC transporter permease [Sulfitobacter mediterraneus]MBM1654889.1 ABC transporter permease [Sulfitobacter mediterraneus]